ncbi:hypothetical protein PVAP13_3KG402313 [Panicum virgatum]|uniref:Uncharacterized protein n=1 Tax=Panicum virgatum TaxID=38727 RepID=A0A8T0V8A3_PANVG|nr:hypothetical protein PVAP13_3KG402313 [Panicum virgatum]
MSVILNQGGIELHHIDNGKKNKLYGGPTLAPVSFWKLRSAKELQKFKRGCRGSVNSETQTWESTEASISRFSLCAQRFQKNKKIKLRGLSKRVDPQKKAPRGRTLQPNEETGHKKRIGFSFFIKEEKGLRSSLQKSGSILARISVYSLTSSTSNYVARSLHSTERRHELQETNQDSSSLQRQEKKQTTRNESGSLVLSSLSETGPSVTFFVRMHRPCAI